MTRIPLADIASVVGCVAVLLLFQELPRADRFAAAMPLLAGVVLVLGMSAGHLARWVGMPRLTGWLVAGVAVNPALPALLHSATDWSPPLLVRAEHASSLGLVNALAIAVIALMGGMEVRVAAVRAAWRAISATALMLFAGVVSAVAATVLLLEPAFLTTAIADGHPGWVVAMLVGVLVAAASPTVVVSVLRETGARGPLSTMILGTTMLLDTMILTAFAVLATVLDSGSGSLLGVGIGVAWSIVLSLALGLAIGIGLARYSERTDHHLTWLLLGLAACTAVAAPVLHLEPLFILLAAGFACTNIGRFSRIGHARIDAALARIGQPLLIAFFVATGMNLHLEALTAVAGTALLLTVVRTVSTWAAATFAGRIAGVPQPHRGIAWLGLLAKAGMTLALAQMTATRFPGWGDALATMIVALVALHELFAPLTLAWVLQRVGESGRRHARAPAGGAH